MKGKDLIKKIEESDYFYHICEPINKPRVFPVGFYENLEIKWSCKHCKETKNIKFTNLTIK